MNLLSEDQLQQYRVQGYCVVERLFDDAELATVDTIIRELTTSALSSDDFSQQLELEPELLAGQPVPRRIYNPYNQHEGFRRLATDSRILDRIEQLVGPDIQLQHSKLNMKPPRVGSTVEWHQDLTYFPHTNDDLVTTLIYLDDATIENGCLQILPGQHRRYLEHADADGVFAGRVTEAIAPLGEPLPLPAPAGSVIFMHCLTPHASAPNHSDRGRRTVIFEYRAADAVPLHFGPMVQRNEALACQLRGQPAKYARLGQIQPLLPRFPGHVSSLYELQAKSRRSN